jgi:hypothetical protein
MPRIATALIAACAAAACAPMTPAQVVWDESIHGDLSTNVAAPTPLVLGVGTSSVLGRMAAPDDIRDLFTFTIGPGQLLTGMFLIDYRDVGTGAPGDTGYIHIDDGTSTVVPSAATMLEFLGGHHLDRDSFPTAADNMLVILSAAPLGGTGFTMPLGPGDYTINVQQTGTPLTSYALDLVVVPGPGALAALAMGAGIAGRRRRARG